MTVMPRKSYYFEDLELGMEASLQKVITEADINAFAIPPSFTPGQSGRNIVSGPGLNWQQFSLARVIPITERLRGMLRFDINQPFKIPFFAAPSALVDFRNPQNFGKIRTAQGGFSGLGARTYMHAVFRLEF